MAHESVQAHYAAHAGHYDLLMRPFADLRTQAIRRLQLAAGARVLELGCGTGTSFPELLHCVGGAGQILGVDRSRAMLAAAQRKADAAGGRQLQLLHADADALALQPASFDAVLAVYTNDIFTSPAAVAQAVGALRPGGRFAITGAKLTDRRHAWLLNRFTRGYASRSITRPLALQPWQALAEQLGELSVEEFRGGSAFVAVGVKGMVNDP